ncbi:MAG: hypothetical protein WAT19_07660 [Ferruginibacter sp.]
MKKGILLLLVSALLFFSCKKDDPAPPVDLSGTTFKGTAVINSINYDPFTIKFNADGTATVTIGSFSPFPGSWNKTPNSSIVYFFFDESATNKWKGNGTLSTNNTKLENGTVTRTAPSVLNGTFTAEKQ